MSQSPYQPPTPYSQPMNFGYYQPDALAPARRAGALQYVVGAIVLLGSFCCVGVGSFLPRMMAERPEVFAELQKLPDASMGFLQMAMFIFAGIVFVIGVGFLVLAGFVRRGSKGAIITSLIFSGLIIVILLLNGIGSVPKMTSMNGPELLGGLCVSVAPLALFAWLMVWLIQAMRSSDQAMAQGYAMQYWQYAQQQAYAQQMMQQPPNPQQPPPQSPPPQPPIE